MKEEDSLRKPSSIKKTKDKQQKYCLWARACTGIYTKEGKEDISIKDNGGPSFTIISKLGEGGRGTKL